jgi:Rrf2 family protein
MISRTAEYAFLALAFLAGQSAEAVTTREIAESTGLPPDYLSKILRALRRHGILLAHRGIGGGFALAKPAESISVLQVLEALGERLPYTEQCPMRLAHHGEVCPVHRALNEAIALIRQRFTDLTLDQLATHIHGAGVGNDVSVRVTPTIGAED